MKSSAISLIYTHLLHRYDIKHILLFRQNMPMLVSGWEGGEEWWREKMGGEG